MSVELGPRHVVAPDGVEWQVSRRWSTRRFGWTWKRRSEIAQPLATVGQGLGGVDLSEGAVVVLAVASALILIPLLFFGVELLILGAFLAAGLVSRVFLRSPWLVEARSSDPLTSGRQLEWRVIGWRRSGKLIDQVVTDLAAGREPPERTLPQ
jgi:hypothetical protein